MNKSAINMMKKVVPNRVIYEVHRLGRIEKEMLEIKQIVSKHDNRLDRLKELIKQVEPYQPTYGIAGILESEPRRNSIDRCRAIEQYMDGKVAAYNMLDIGSSLGYICFYFADRGAITEGWDANPKNAEVSRLISEINGIPVKIMTKNFDRDSIKTIKPDTYDVVTILSVMHHIIHNKGLKYAQELMKELVGRVPTVIVELAKKGEDTSLFWDKSQPDGELEIFKLVKDKISVAEIGTFHNHLSENKRPLYAITLKKRVVKLNNKSYTYNYKTNQAYTKSPAPYLELPRYYYFLDKYIVKEYIFKGINKAENSRQIISEINSLLHLTGIHNMPKLLDYEVSSERTKLVVDRIKGDLLIDAIEKGKKVDPKIILFDVLKTLSDLEKHGLYHNDVRTWNIIYDGKKASLIDYGVVSHRVTDGDLTSLLWVLNAILIKQREGYSTRKQKLPNRTNFKSNKTLDLVYEQVLQGVTSPSQILKLL